MLNASVMRGLERGDSLCDIFKASGIVEEELSLFAFSFWLIVINVSYLSVL